MIISVANPIYDSVFKYLMEDERVAKTVLSALLKREVVEVKMRKHEYTNGSRDKISMFRIDFGAKVRQDDGSLKLVLIELQKTWLETETLRFRQYLGTQYADPDNIVREGDQSGMGIPMISVYLLGHRVGDIEEPVLYVLHKSYDYEDRLVTRGIPDPFVDSLVHDSIIVQIPLLHGHVNNRLVEVLGVFDQTRKDRHNRQVLNIDDSEYDGDGEMRHILHRLLAAASDTKLRQDMNVEDEYFSAIETRDTAIMMRDKKIAEQDAILEQRGAQLEQKDAQLEQKDAQLEQKDAQLEQKDAQLEQKDAQLEQKDAQLEQKDAQLEQKDAQLEQKDAQLEQKDAQLEQKDAQLEQKDAQLEQKDAQLEQKDAQLEQKDAQLEQKDAQLMAKDNALLASAKALVKAGVAVERVSEMTGLPVDRLVEEGE